MATKQKYYAVRKGCKVGIFLTWAECQEATKGFSGPEFKAFESESEAEAYLNDEDIVLQNEIIPRLKNGEVVAFTDGSFDATKQAYGSGVCIFAPDNTQIELSNRGNNDKYIELRNIAGEIIAVLSAVDWAWKNGFNAISIFHDYEGISKWASGEWKANKNLSQYYEKFINEKSDVIKIKFVKVSGHSNNKYNDRADVLAKGAIFDNKVIRDAGVNGGYIISPVKEVDVTALMEKLKNECVGLDFSIVEADNKKIWSIQFSKERLTISLFNNIKMVVQGRRSNLFQIVTTGIVETIKCGDFIKVLKDAYGIAIDKVKVEDDFKSELPSISGKTLPDNIAILLKQAIINLSNPARSDSEFTMYTFPVLKALEGVLKYNLQKCEILMTSMTFDMFDKVKGVFELKANYKHIISSENAIKIKNCYNHFHNNRHTLFHFGIIIGGIDANTRLLKTKHEANDIIRDTLRIIDDNYIA